jgi:proline iminopeptidase
VKLAFILFALALAVPAHAKDGYFDNTGRADAWQGGVRMIPITTPRGSFRVWTKRTGNNPKLKVLLLHGGPALTHEYWEVMDSYLPAAGVEYYYYDQLGSAYSDQPTDTTLWEIPRFVDEVEQVRKALGLDEKNLVLMGHSWGGILAMEYALAHPDHLKGLVISSMMSSIPAYNRYAHDILMPKMPPDVLKQILAFEEARDYENPKYMELLFPTWYTAHFLRRPFEQWPEPVMRSIAHMNRSIYVPMQGPSEMSASGRLLNWDRSQDLGKIQVPTLVICGGYDTMDPKQMEWMAKQFPQGRFLLCPEGGHMAFYDDPEPYFKGLLAFLKDLEGMP